MSKSFPLVPIGEVAFSVERPEAPLPGTVYRQVGVHLWGEGAYERESIDGGETKYSTLHCVESGDIIVNKIWARNGSVAVVNDELAGCFCSGEFPIYAPDRNRIEPRWFHWITKTSWFWHECDLKSRGTSGKNRIRPEKFLEIQIPLPPMEEQRRIVAKIDELTAKIEEATRVRQQATQEAEALTDSMMNEILNKASGKTSWELGPIPMFANVNPSRTGQINLSMDDPVSFVPMKAVDDVRGTIAWPEIRPFAEVAKGYTWFKEGDVIWARITPCMQNGKAAIARNLVNGIGFGSTEFHIIRPGPKLLGEWLYALVRHKAFRDDAARHFKGTAGQQRVPQSFLEQRVIVAPPLTEQQQIVTELDALQGKVDTLKRIQAETNSKLEALLPSILDKAFKGEL